MGGAKSCSSYCGYHDAVGKVYYAVMPYPNCAGCLGGMAALDALTGTSSHELCEAITDPVPGSGWYDNLNGEIGDICAWRFKKTAGYTVQLEWSNAKSQCVGCRYSGRQNCHGASPCFTAATASAAVRAVATLVPGSRRSR